MLKDNILLMRMARESLDGKWGLAIGTFLIYSLIMSTTGSIGASGSIISLLIGGPFALGVATFSLSISRGKEARLEQIFKGSVTLQLILLLICLCWYLYYCGRCFLLFRES